MFPKWNSPCLGISPAIDFSTEPRPWLSTENRLRSQRTPTPYKIKVNICKLIDLVIRIKLIRTIFVPLFSNFLRNSTIHFRMFLYLETCFLRVTDLLLCRLQVVSEIHAPIYPYLISERRRNCSTLWPAQQQNRDLRKHVTKHKNMWEWMVEFLRKFENRGIKIARVNSILITKSINLQLCTLNLDGGVGPLWCWHL